MDLQQVKRYPYSSTSPPIPDASLMRSPLSPEETIGLAKSPPQSQPRDFLLRDYVLHCFQLFHFTFRGSQLGMPAGAQRMLHVWNSRWSIHRWSIHSVIL